MIERIRPLSFVTFAHVCFILFVSPCLLSRWKRVDLSYFVVCNGDFFCDDFISFRKFPARNLNKFRVLTSDFMWNLNTFHYFCVLFCLWRLYSFGIPLLILLNVFTSDVVPFFSTLLVAFIFALILERQFTKQ